MTNLADFIPLRILLLQWLAAWSCIGGVGMGIDKFAARLGYDRIPERAFLVTALLGGFAGIILVGLLVHHKTSKGEFWFPVGLAALLWLIALIVYYFPALIPS